MYNFLNEGDTVKKFNRMSQSGLITTKINECLKSKVSASKNKINI